MPVTQFKKKMLPSPTVSVWPAAPPAGAADSVRHLQALLAVGHVCSHPPATGCVYLDLTWTDVLSQGPLTSCFPPVLACRGAGPFSGLC